MNQYDMTATESEILQWSSALASAKKYLDERQKKNRNLKYMYHWLQTCDSFKDVTICYDKIESMLKKQEITHDDYIALNTVICDMVTTGTFNKEIRATVEIDEHMTNYFHRRIWSESNINKVVQFRNCVTDMFSLDMITLEEYIDLNNEIDRYIQYTLSNGGR